MALRTLQGFWLGLLAAGLAAFISVPAKADSTTGQLLDRAKHEDADNKPLAALRDAQAAYDRLWQASPLFLTQALFIKEDPQGYGHYDPRADAVFTSQDPLYIYIEPAAYGFQ